MHRYIDSYENSAEVSAAIARYRAGRNHEAQGRTPDSRRQPGGGSDVGSTGKRRAADESTLLCGFGELGRQSAGGDEARGVAVVTSTVTPEVQTETVDQPSPVCSPSKDAILKQDRFTKLASRLQREGHIVEDEAALLWDAATDAGDDAIQVAAPWESRSSLCGSWGRNLVAPQDARPNGAVGCWTCLMAAEWIERQAAADRSSEDAPPDGERGA